MTVNRSTTNLVRGELGRYSLKKMYIEKNLRYLKYLKEKGVSLVKQAYDYELSKENHGTTIKSSILKITSILGESNAQNTDILENNYWEAKNIINSIFEKEWTQSLNKPPKSDTYSLFQQRWYFT